MLPTETIIGNYRIEERIGRGGMGVVYRGHHLTLPREVAIKSISKGSHLDLRRLRSRFEKEAFIQSQLDHSGIVKIYDYIVAAEKYYIVMEFVEGRSLAQILEREGSPLGIDRALDLFEQILAAVGYAQDFVYEDQDGSSHRGLIHRDLKPANILVTPEGQIKVTDFGIVKLVGSEKTNTADDYGSPEYVSPEQAEGIELDPRSDIYSLGIILYEMVTGNPPFHDHGHKQSQLSIVRAHIHQTPAPPSESNPQVTPRLEAVILRALEKRPENRFASAEQFLRAVLDLRGRDHRYLNQSAMAGKRAHTVGTQEIQRSSSFDLERQSYSTQPIKAQVCPSCGTEAGRSEIHCRQCGHDLGGASATVRLARDEGKEWQGKRSLGFKLSIVVFILALGGTAMFLVKRKAGSEPGVIQSTPESAEDSPLPGLVEIRPASVAVDSNYDGYTPTPLTDGEMDVRVIAKKRYNEGNWASAETPAPHWIDLEFDKPVRIASVYLYWGFDRGRFMPSRSAELQIKDQAGSWQTISRLEPEKDHDRMAFEFDPIRTAAVRILQPAQKGPPNRPFLMWVREVKVFGVAE